MSINIRGQISFQTSILSDSGVYNYDKISINTFEIMATSAVMIGVGALCVAALPIGIAITAGLLIMIQEQNSIQGGIRWND